MDLQLRGWWGLCLPLGPAGHIGVVGHLGPVEGALHCSADPPTPLSWYREGQGRPSVCGSSKLCARVGWEGVAVGQERAAAPVRVPAWAAQNFIVMDKDKQLLKKSFFPPI